MGRGWPGLGLARLLSKYHAVFLPAGAFLYIVLEPSARRALLKPGPYLALAIGILVFSPVQILAWNASHGYGRRSRFRGAGCGQGRSSGPTPWPGRSVARPRTSSPGSALAAGGLVVSVLVEVPPRGFDGERFLVCQSVAPLAAFTAVACLRPVLPHWTLVGYLALFPLLGRLWESRFRERPRKMGGLLALAAAVPIGVASFLVVEYRTGALQVVGLPPKVDPTVDMYGWDQVSSELGRRGLLDDPNTFLFSRSWFTSGHLAFATRKSGVPVLCYNHKDARSFAFWSRPDEWVGRDGILVSVDEANYEPACYERFFERIEPLGVFEVKRAGGPIRQVRLYRCVRQLLAFPFLPGDPDPSKARVAAELDEADAAIRR